MGPVLDVCDDDDLCVCVSMDFLINMERPLSVKFIGFFVFCSDLLRLTGNPKDDYENLSFLLSKSFSCI